jgi:protein subunit release factor A
MAELAKQELAECEREISNIKAALRSMGQPQEGEQEPNRLVVVWVSVGGEF